MYQAEVQADRTAAQQPHMARRNKSRMAVKVVDPLKGALVNLGLSRGGTHLRGAIDTSTEMLCTCNIVKRLDGHNALHLLQGLSYRLQPASA